MEVQQTTQALPVWMIPRIDGNPKTITQIKEQYSNHYVSDEATPINFWLQHQAEDGTKTNILWDDSKTIDDMIIYFAIPNEIYADLQELTVLFFWTLGEVSGDPPEPPADTERIFTIEPVLLQVKDLHQEA